MKKACLVSGLLIFTQIYKPLCAMEAQNIETRKRTFSAENASGSCPIGTSAEHSKPLLEAAPDGSAEHTCPATQEVQLLQTLLKTLAQKTVVEESTRAKAQTALSKALDENQILKTRFQLLKTEFAQDLVLNPRAITMSQELIMLLAPEWGRLGDKYYYGKGVPVNLEMAKKFFEKAAQQEVHKETQANARTMLGEMYYLACGVKKDNKAIEFFAKAEAILFGSYL